MKAMVKGISLNSTVHLEYQMIPGVELRQECIQETANRYLIRISGKLIESVAVGDWQVRIIPAFRPTFTYTCHLTPDEDYVVDMHVFRTPAMIMGHDDGMVCVLPVTDGVQNGPNRYYLDLDAPNAVMTLGITTTRIAEHVMYKRTDEAVLPEGDFLFQFRLLFLEGEETRNPFRSILAFYWENLGTKHRALLPKCTELMPYVRHTYDWAFDRWKDIMWQEFSMEGRTVGAPQFIVVAQQSPNYGKPCSVREMKSVWNQAWFSSLRSAQGLYRYGMETGNGEYVRKARLTKELALALPQDDGLFDSIVAVPNEEVEIDGAVYRQARPWTELYYANSNRNPQTRDVAQSPRHILDMSWTALKMLEWYEELEQDERLVEYVTCYADRLLTLQDGKGYFPAWLEKGSGRILPELEQSPESAVSVTMLVKLYRISGEKRYLDAALRCMDVLIREVIPEHRWEDFETYWSCSRYGSTDLVGRRIHRNNCYKECSLSPYWMAEALLECYTTTGDPVYLERGEYCLDVTLMFQSSYQPDYIPTTVVGGFGVMNCDAELNDARQSLFAELILRYGRLLNRQEYMERGIAALSASFSVMYCPENPGVKEQWEKRWPFFNERDYGFMMENCGHDGYFHGDDLKLGLFTIYDWGNGAASEAVMRIRAHFPELWNE